ncbi:DNA replication and repair protein RecF [bacterium]|nr:DNA replication and repair protein RecF [bacterium]
MFVEKISLKSFRNILVANDTFCPRVNILFGENAQGKTNYIESIYAAIHGESFRTSEYRYLINEKSTFTSIDVYLEKKKLKHHLNVQLSENEKKILHNGKKVSKSTIRSEFSTILFSPESLSVIKNSDRERRDLIDQLIEDIFPEKRKSLSDYRRLLKQRNALLKDFKEKKFEINPRNVLFLETLTEQYLLVAAEIVELRLQAIEKILPRLSKVLTEIFSERAVEIAVDYVISDQKFRQINKQEALDAMYKRWLQLKSAEIKYGHSLVGAHKHDICLLFNGKDSRDYCSQGQQRLLILAFKMAQIGLHFDVHSTYPILLLDDVLSEIDEMKRLRLMEVLETLCAQIFITTTENTILRYLQRSTYSVFEVKNGQINSTVGHQEELSVR